MIEDPDNFMDKMKRTQGGSSGKKAKIEVIPEK